MPIRSRSPEVVVAGTPAGEVGSSPARNGPSENSGSRHTPDAEREDPWNDSTWPSDLHRLRSLIVREDEDGREVGVVRIDNDPVALALAVADAGPNPEVAIEATYGWYWAVDVLQAEGAQVH